MLCLQGGGLARLQRVNCGMPALGKAFPADLSCRIPVTSKVACGMPLQVAECWFCVLVPSLCMHAPARKLPVCTLGEHLRVKCEQARAFLAALA